MVAGVAILLQPASGGVAFVWVLGLFALVTGPLLIALSIALSGEPEGDRGGSDARLADDRERRRRK